MLQMSIYRTWKDRHATGTHILFLEWNLFVCALIVGGRLKLYIVSMRSKGPHKQELASGLFGSFTHTAPGCV